MVIGAGGSKDFSIRQKRYESRKNFEERKSVEKICMPTGEELVQEMSDFEKYLKKEISQLKERRLDDEELLKTIYLLNKYDTAGKILSKINWNQLYQNQFYNISEEDHKILLQFFEEFYDIKKELIHAKDKITNRIGNWSIDGLKYEGILRIITDFLEIIQKSKNDVSVVKSYFRHYTHNIKLVSEHLFYDGYFSNCIKEYLKDSGIELLEKEQKKYFKSHIKLAKLLKFYDPISIDNFLSSIESSLIAINIDQGEILESKEEKKERKELVKAGKELIAFYLLKNEKKDIFNSDNKIWYRWFREAIINSYANKNSSSEKKAKNPNEVIIEMINRLQIINFNYDRSFNHFLKEKMNHKVTVNRSKKNICEEIKKMTYYPYGCLDEKVKNEKPFDEIPYGGFAEKLKSEKNLKDFFDKYIKYYANRIFIIHEERNGKILEGEDVIRHINSSLADLKRSISLYKNNNQNHSINNLEENFKYDKQVLYFLGFGFIQENINKIISEKNNCQEVKIMSGITFAEKRMYSVRKIFYTNYEDSEKINDLVRKNFINRLNTKNSEDNIRSKKGVYDALSEDFPLII